MDSTGDNVESIELYTNITDATPAKTIDYAEYSEDANSLIGIYFTDTCEFGYYKDSAEFWTDFNNEPTLTGIQAMYADFGTLVFTDYIYYEDYYLSSVDIGNVVTSDIVKMLNGVEGDKVSVIFWATESKFSFNKFMDNYFLRTGAGSGSNKTYTPDYISDLTNSKVKPATNVLDLKVSNQVEMMRLAAPNYSSFFDVNVQRNKGIEYIHVDCMYKPYQPYIHLNPNFKGLYGSDYNDARGLICGGDYSIALATDAWATYQLQNKNYQAIFDRQIQQLEVQQSIQAQSDVANAIAGVGTGAIGGALVGAKFGGGYGAIAGAVVGGVTSAVGGAADVMNNQRMRELQISTMKDIHGYQLGNIKALPQGLSKTDYLTNNNKLFPFMEFYTCTPIEEQAVRSQLDYNGMTINRVGKISEFQTTNELPYIKAKLIRIDLTDDAHLVKDIADELATGVYLPKGEQ